ncbi:spinster family MFS transporter [Novosphingobium pentaromativorans]|uniref:Major facilitator superfamily (MFS) profile domain-containing protein n=1 Tax=Novosphingobium pentaromativorans US6-1 TaxID=1088721 RepID=G6ED34_9SPHN|nr:MFS transporter [Novosphingobium pentaromativorans]AIT79862.1 hypothetical protein JI59_08800 [Novosphingobium pentaromativorans US6-1]EHJ60746.1 hypothetical protein NSU_2255 [Novosphingobium pentaromativorans US6-1]
MRESPAEVISTARKAYVLTCLTALSFFAYMDRMALAILAEPIKQDLNLSDTQLGLLTGFAFVLFYATLGLPLARIADRGSRVRVLSICLALWSVMTIVSGHARNFITLFLARSGVGVGEAGCVPPAHALIGDYFSRERRALAISVFQCGAVLGLSVGVAAVGLMAEYLGWRTCLLVIGCAGLPLALLIKLTVREPQREFGTATSHESYWRGFETLLRRPAFVHIMLAYSLSAGCMTGVSLWFPTYFLRSFGMSLAEVGVWIGTASGVSGVLGLLTGGMVTAALLRRDARWEIWLPALTYFTSVPLYAIMLTTSSAFVALILKTVAGYFSSFGGGVALAAIQSFTQPHQRATAVSMVLFASSLLGSGFGPYIVGALSDLLAPAYGEDSLRYALLVTCGLLLWSVVHYLLCARRVGRSVA